MENQETLYAEVKVRCDNTIVSIPVTSKSKPVITASVKERWQKIIDITARCMNVPSALIMEVREGDISVFVTSSTIDNPYIAGSSEELKCGLYCETVLGKNAPLYVADAMDSAYWCDNPDISFGMKSYLGFPVKWPDGEFFGTICVLDSVENPYMQSYAELMELVQELIERDLCLVQNRIADTCSAYSVLTDKIDMPGRERSGLLKSNTETSDLIEKIYDVVKNGLDILSMQTGIKSDSNSGSAMIMKDMKARLDSFICMLNSLYNTINDQVIPMGVCVRDMVERIKKDYSSECANISFGIDIPSYIALDAEPAFYCGMIVTEALINSVRHAFINIINGEVYIMIRENRPGEYMLYISDNGTGLSAKKMENGTGLKIIKRLVKRLNGTVHIVSNRGTSYYIDFKRPSECSEVYP